MTMSIGDMGAMLRLLKKDVETAKGTMDKVTKTADDAINELESIRQDSEQVSGELNDYLSNLANLENAIEKADCVVDAAKNQHLEI